MRILPTLGLALRRLHRRPIRSFLLLQGTIWGVAVAVFPTAVIDGTRLSAVDDGRALGVDRVVVAADPTSARPVLLEASDVPYLTGRLALEGYDVMAAAAVRVERDLGLTSVDADVDDVTVLGATPRSPTARGLELATGRAMTLDDRDDVCLVEALVGQALGRPDLAPGDTIRIGDRDRRVVGVLAPRSRQARTTNDLGFDLEHPMYQKVAEQFLLAMGMPIVIDDGWKRTDTCVYLPAQQGTFDWLYVRVGTRETSDAAKAIRRAMVEREKTVLTMYPVVLPVMMGSDINRFDTVNIALFLACLVMGAVVMANLGLLNVLTRSREIAIRRVEGATQLDVSSHFFLEGLILSVIGAALGCLLGMGLAELRASIEPVAGFAWTFPVKHALIACAVAIVIGLLAALLPAIRASRQQPVQGLYGD